MTHDREPSMELKNIHECHVHIHQLSTYVINHTGNLLQLHIHFIQTFIKNQRKVLDTKTTPQNVYGEQNGWIFRVKAFEYLQMIRQFVLNNVFKLYSVSISCTTVN